MRFQNKGIRFCFLSVLLSAMLSACGSADDEYRSELLGVSGTGEHEICAQEVNARNAANIEKIQFVARNNEKIWPLGSQSRFNGYLFELVEFKERKMKVWIASDYICKTGTNARGAPKIEVNLTTNRLTFYRGGTAIRSWNVGTARPGKITPTGNFNVKIKQICPPYYGASGDKNVAGCSPTNPLGTRAIWFIDTMYGLHGTNQPYLIADGTSAQARRLSAGCVRNLNGNIEWLFDQVKAGDQITIIR